jgi:glucans biosynthesis protein
VDVDARLVLRRPVAKLGIAPLTSMFFHGENTLGGPVDFRPEVHDSDGLLLELASGEWLWRPLENPRAVQASALAAASPRGFGLVQRDRDFASYQDLETHAELRPSAWVAPRGEWGEGHVELIEIPTDSDVTDNVVAYWVPRTPPAPGTPGSFSYTLSWYGDDPTRPPGGRVVATRRDFGTLDNVQRFVVDFAGGTLAAVPAERTPRGVVSVAGGAEAGAVLDQHVVRNDATGGWRLTFQVRPFRRGPLELRAFLAGDGDAALTETWSYMVLP